MSSPTQENEPASQLNAIAWAVFFVWAGIAMLADIQWGWFLLGTGVLILTAQFARWRTGVEIENFWLVCGAIFLVGGVWRLLDLPWPLVPLMLILLGLISLVRTIGRARR